MNIKIKGTILVLNTIDNLEPNKKVWISRQSVMFSEEGEIYVDKKAQFVNQQEGSYSIPVEIDSEGCITLDFTEVQYAFVTYSKKELEKYEKDEWHIMEAPMEKQKDTLDWIRRYTIADVFSSFMTVLLNSDYPENYFICMKDTLLQRIPTCSNRSLLETILLCCKRDYKTEVMERDEMQAEMEADKSLVGKLEKRVTYLAPIFREIQEAIDIRLLILPVDETEESMQSELDKYTREEDWLKVKQIRDKMTEKGFTPRE